VRIKRTEVVREYNGTAVNEYVPGYDDEVFSAFLARRPELFRVVAILDRPPAIEYHDPMAGWHPVGHVSRAWRSNAIGPTIVRARNAARSLGLACVGFTGAWSDRAADQGREHQARLTAGGRGKCRSNPPSPDDPINCGEIVRRGVAGGESWVIARERRGVYRLWAAQPGSSGEYRPIRYLSRLGMRTYAGSTSGEVAIEMAVRL
jgi:hypothetical protein